MAHSGFTPYSHRDFIKQLRQLLQDRYTWDGDGFTLLKELIQNANDAGASCLDLGWSSPLYPAAAVRPSGDDLGIPRRGEPHPLLTVPALFAVNNGPFLAADAANITRLGSNSKAGESTAAGRFGLGLKSVFHLCEAFFYLAAPFSSSHDRLCRIFNPWSPPWGCNETGPHEAWDFEADDPVAEQVESLIRQRLAPIIARNPRYFCLWVPLRDSRCLQGNPPIISGAFGEGLLGEMLGRDDLTARLAEVLPLLHTLSEIRIWQNQGADGIKERCAVRASASSVCVPRLPEVRDDEYPPPRQTKLSGDIEIDENGERARSCRFVGVESISASETLQTLWRHPNWPTDESLYPETNQWRDHRAKLLPHGAVRFMAAPVSNGPGRVSLHWCVFLPLGSVTGEEHLETTMAVRAHVSVYLHGFFFIDSGRKRHLRTTVERAEFANLNAEQLQQEWNGEIEREVIWPRLLESLAQFVADAQWSGHQVGELTRALQRLLGEMNVRSHDVLKIVTSRRQWLYALESEPAGGTQGQWKLVPASKTVYTVPAVPTDVRLSAMLPGLFDLGETRLLTVADLPRLAAAEAVPWPVSLLGKMAASLVADEALAMAANTKYLVDLLEHCAGDDDEKRAAIGEALWPILKKALATESWNLRAIERDARALQRLFAFVPEERRLFLTWAASDRNGAQGVVQLLASDEWEIVPVPQAVRPPAPARDQQQLSSTVVIRLLQKIANRSLPTELLADVAGHLLDRADLDRESLSSSLADLPLIVVQNYETDQRARVTWEECERQKRKRLVFSDLAGLTKQLQQAVGRAASVWRIDPEFARRVLGEKHGLPNCTARECVSTLAADDREDSPRFGARELGGWRPRSELLSRILELLERGSSEEQARARRACRLLLHGLVQQARFHADLFVTCEPEPDRLAEKLVHHMLRRRTPPATDDEQWRIIRGVPADWVARKLNEEQRGQLGLVPLRLTEPAVLDVLAHAAPSDIAELEVSREEYGRLLTEIDSTRVALLQCLPIHPTTDGRRVAIADGDPPRFYWDDGYEVDRGLAAGITFLKPDRRKAVCDRQRLLAPAFDRDFALRLALACPQPDQHWRTIVAAIGKSEEPPAEDILASLRKAKWMPSAAGGKECDDLIWLSDAVELTADFRQCVDRLADDCNGAYVPDWGLAPAFLEQLAAGQAAVRARLRAWHVVPDEDSSLRQLGLMLSEQAANAIGHLPRDYFEDWAELDWDRRVMPAHHVLKIVADCFGTDRCFDLVSDGVREPVKEIGRLGAILDALAAEHERSLTRERKERVFRVFLKYLDFFLLHPEFGFLHRLGSVRLFSQAGTWTAGVKLCLPPAPGIPAEHVVDAKIAGLLRDRGKTATADESEVVGANRSGGASQPGECAPCGDDQATALASYFSGWEGHLPTDVIGGFLGLLGGDPQMEELANRYLGKRSLDETRRNLQITPHSIGARPMRMADHRVHVTVLAEGTVSVRNLFGERFAVPLARECDSLLVGFGDGRHVQVREQRGQRNLRIQLRHIDAGRHAADRLAHLLQDASTALLAEGYGLHANEELRRVVEQTFDDLRQSDQLEIRVTQQLILEDAELLLSQLGLQTDEVFGPVIASLTRFRRVRAERSHNEQRFDRKASWTDDEVEAEHRATNKRLRRLLEQDPDGQRRVLAAVRQKIQGHNQYNPAAVPFELFQNADDACEERTQFLGRDVPCDTITYFLGSETLAIRHFGRCINQVPPGVDPRTHRLADDLRKMLTLWLSNKDSAENKSTDVELTGKFGLGFKSVFLVSDRPRLLSGQLACEIVGGVYPRYIDVTERQCFDRYVEKLTAELQREASTIELPLTVSATDDRPLQAVNEVVGRFRELAHLLVVFARRIRRIEIQVAESGRTFVSAWQDMPVPGVAHCYRGTLAPFPDFLSGKSRAGDARSEMRTLVLRTKQHAGALLFVHDGRRLQKLSNDVPTLWVTAPTRECLRVGFALNAAFALDPGRAQLGRESPENEERAACLGRELGERLVAVFEHRRKVGWEQFCRDLGLDGSAEEYAFWESLWELLGPGLANLPETSDAARILQQIFWGPEGAAAALYRRCAALPGRLKGAAFQSTLTSLPDVQFSVAGVLASDDGFSVMCVRNWGAFQKRQGRGHVVSDPLVADALRRLNCPCEKLAVKVELAKLLEWESPDYCIDPTLAEQFGELTNNDSTLHGDRTDEPGIADFVRQARFKDRTGASQAANRLLIGHQPPRVSATARSEERMRAAFAPEDRILSDEYGAQGLTFFEACREKLVAPTDDLANWVLAANKDAPRAAALRYLAEGDLRLEVQAEIKRRGGIQGTWLEGLAEDPRFLGMAVEQQGQLLGLLPDRAARQLITDVLRGPEPVLHLDPASVLEKIHAWWSSQGVRQIHDYEREVYPDAGLRHLKGERDERFRKDWVVLFLLGLTHTMGRTVAEQHRGFLMQNTARLDMIASSEREPAAWMQWVNEFLDKQVDDSRFLEWMKQFVGIYQVSRHLDIYIAAFEAVERMSRPFALTEVTELLSSSLFQGSGLEAPSLRRVLGMGQCFVLRELVRHGIIRNKHAFRHCYVPVKRVRELLTFLGCDELEQVGRKWELSATIYSYLSEHLGAERATFGYAFDIPFQRIAEDENLQERFLQRSVSFDDDDEDLWTVAEESDASGTADAGQ